MGGLLLIIKNVAHLYRYLCFIALLLYCFIALLLASLKLLTFKCWSMKNSNSFSFIPPSTSMCFAWASIACKTMVHGYKVAKRWYMIRFCQNHIYTVYTGVDGIFGREIYNIRSYIRFWPTLYMIGLTNKSGPFENTVL